MFSVCYKFDDVREQFGQAISELLCGSVSKRVVVENFPSVIELDVELDVDSVSTRGDGELRNSLMHSFKSSEH